MRLRRRRSAALQMAIEAKGSLKALADGLGISIQAVSQWDEVPAERCLQVERLTGVPREDLRPDIYSDNSAASRAVEAAA